MKSFDKSINSRAESLNVRNTNKGILQGDIEGNQPKNLEPLHLHDRDINILSYRDDEHIKTTFDRKVLEFYFS